MFYYKTQQEHLMWCVQKDLDKSLDSTLGRDNKLGIVRVYIELQPVGESRGG